MFKMILHVLCRCLTGIRPVG